jgi:hypothetical protein
MPQNGVGVAAAKKQYRKLPPEQAMQYQKAGA